MFFSISTSSCQPPSVMPRQRIHSNSVNPFTAMVSFENDKKKKYKKKKEEEKKRNLKPLSILTSFFALECERIFIKTHTIESRCRTKKYTVYRRVCASFSPEMLQAGAVKGLIHCYNAKNQPSLYLFTLCTISRVLVHIYVP